MADADPVAEARRRRSDTVAGLVAELDATRLGVEEAPRRPAIEAAVVGALRARGETVAVAESLTGGLLAATIVNVAGASAAFRGGLIVYATDLKASLAGVPADLLARQGPVDPEVATELARGTRERCQADWGLATTGVAGPDPQDGIPVGTVYVGLAGPVGPAQARQLHLSGDRMAIRRATVEAALGFLLDALAR
jgi:nicotinamide-nucleotide amidase